ncbi:MAG: D-alanine--D-alanine ligase, partial [Candidatus Thiodiazotropha sp. (ex Lucinoma kastoroae)]|nr:D-alanine--D-alanine ligase [Candidatus Thiodiazotropha sp. (ex Lucinoma kastoroae)]
ETTLQALCQQAFDVVGASGWGRVDLMLDKHSQPWLIEVNTVPGMTDHSLVPMSARAAGIDFEALVVRILATSIQRGRG